MPTLFNFKCQRDDLRRWFLDKLDEPEALCPAEGCYSLDGLYLFCGQQALTPDGEYLPDTILDWSSADAAHETLKGAIQFAATHTFDDGTHTAVVYKSGSANYGHFLSDIAPKLANIARAGHSRVRYIVPHDAAWSWPLLEHISRAHGIEPIRWDFPENKLIRVYGATFWSPVSRHNQGPRKSHALLEMKRRLLPDQQTDREVRLYVTRAGHKRGIENSGEVEAMFVRAGYEVVDPAALPFPEQVRLFSSASHIAGPLGAGMANMIFAPSGCEVLMIDPGLGDRYFWDLSCLMGQRFHWLFAVPLDHYSLERATTPFHVAPSAAQSALATTLANS